MPKLNMGLIQFSQRGFAKKKKLKKETLDIRGLRKSVFNPDVTKNVSKDDEVIVGPTWVITPKTVFNPDGEKDSSVNWIKKELESAFHKAFPQTQAMAHRGKRFLNKFHFKHPELHLMTSQKIKDFLIENEIQRVLVFADGWNDTKCNEEYGKIYINKHGKIISENPDAPNHKLKEESVEVNLPITYFLRDLISE